MGIYIRLQTPGYIYQAPNLRELRYIYICIYMYMYTIYMSKSSPSPQQKQKQKIEK